MSTESSPEPSTAPSQGASNTPSSLEPVPVVIAIDGPSGSGKSSVSKAVATRLGYGYVDTGAMYRALAWYCLDLGLGLTDQAAVAQAARDLPLELGTDPSAPTVVVGGTDVSAAIRTTEISSRVSAVATNLDVRAELVRRQRELIAAVAASQGGVVAEGRDLTTVVVPDATVRLLVTASEEARLARRSTELHGTADAAAVAATRDQIVRRDKDDSAVSQFLTAAPGVTVVDTSELDFAGSVQAVLDEVNAVPTTR